MGTPAGAKWSRLPDCAIVCPTDRRRGRPFPADRPPCAISSNSDGGSPGPRPAGRFRRTRAAGPRARPSGPADAPRDGPGPDRGKDIN